MIKLHDLLAHAFDVSENNSIAEALNRTTAPVVLRTVSIIVSWCSDAKHRLGCSGY